MNEEVINDGNKLVQKSLKGEKFSIWKAISVLKVGESGIITSRQAKAGNVKVRVCQINSSNDPKYKDFNFSTSEVGLVNCIRVTRNKII